jgi:hypothetical protein
MNTGRLRRLLAWTTAALACTAVVLAYLNPALIVDLGNRLWACF